MNFTGLPAGTRISLIAVRPSGYLTSNIHCLPLTYTSVAPATGIRWSA